MLLMGEREDLDIQSLSLNEGGIHDGLKNHPMPTTNLNQAQQLHRTSPGAKTAHSQAQTSTPIPAIGSPASGTVRPLQLNSEMQARLMAFQQKRTQGLNSPPLPPTGSSPGTTNMHFLDNNRQLPQQSAPHQYHSLPYQLFGQGQYHYGQSGAQNNYPNQASQSDYHSQPVANHLQNHQHHAHYDNELFPNQVPHDLQTANQRQGQGKPLPPLPTAPIQHQEPVREAFKKTVSDSTVQHLPGHLLPSPIDPENSSSRVKQAINKAHQPDIPQLEHNHPHQPVVGNGIPRGACNGSINGSTQMSTNSPQDVNTPTSPQNVTPISSPTVFSNQPFGLTKKKPSLSQRRGMKLNMNDLTGPSSPESNTLKSKRLSPILGQSSGGLARNLSDRKPKPKFKLDLNDLPDKKNAGSSTDAGSATGSTSSMSSESSKKPQLQGLFANYSKYVDIKSGLLNFAGKASLHSKGVDFSLGSSFRISLEEFEYVEELGRGNYGSVSKVLHKPTGVLMAMKEVRLELDETKFTQILMELEILHKCDSPYIVDFYGAFFVEGAVYMCMEYMDGGSLDKIFGNGHGMKDEACLAYISESVIQGLKELKDRHNIIHRDVKPTNILINTQGKVKLCDFGVSGNLVASLAKTNIGCQSYMAPERIKSMNPDDATYSVQSDVWSLGLTILEVAAGQYPYPSETYGNIFSQLSAIVDGEPPKLDGNVFSKEAQMFVWSCLNKNPDKRPSYGALLKNPWLGKYRGVKTNIAQIVTARVEVIVEEEKKHNLSRSNSAKSQSAAFSLVPNSSSIHGFSSAGASAPNIPNNADSVHSLLRSKVKPPALHRGGGMNSNRNFLNRG